MWTIEYPHVVIFIDSQTRDASEFPLVRQWLWPVRIEFVFWRGLRLRSQRDTQYKQADACQQNERAVRYTPFDAHQTLLKLRCGTLGFELQLRGVYSRSKCVSINRQSSAVANSQGPVFAVTMVG